MIKSDFKLVHLEREILLQPAKTCNCIVWFLQIFKVMYIMNYLYSYKS